MSVEDCIEVLDNAVGYLVGSYHLKEARGNRRYISRIDEGPETPDMIYAAYATAQEEPESIHRGEWVILRLTVYTSLSRGEAGTGTLSVRHEVDGTTRSKEAFSVPDADPATIADIAESYLV